MIRPAPLRHIVTACALASALVPPMTASAQTQGNPCGELRNHYGPFDYRKVRGEQLEIVERAHFTVGVQTLTKPATTTEREMAADVSYVLHAFPNHHRALITMVRLGERHKTLMPPGAKFSIPCYFDRAVRFAPDDTVARALLADYLAKNDRKEDAVRQLDYAVEKAEDNALSHYNLGLVYLELREYDKALQQAHRAQALGLPRTQLMEKLKRENKWRDPPASPSDPGLAAASSASTSTSTTSTAPVPASSNDGGAGAGGSAASAASATR